MSARFRGGTATGVQDGALRHVNCIIGSVFKIPLSPRCRDFHVADGESRPSAGARFRAPFAQRKTGMVSPSQPHEASRSQRAQILLDRGMAALRRGARGLARNRLVRVVELEPTTANAWIALARAAVSPTDAVSHLRRALELAPESAVARAGLLWHSSMIEEPASSESNAPVATLELPVTQGSEESQPAGEPAVELAVPESIVASAELTEFETRSVQTTIVAPPADESLMFEVGGASEFPVASTESPEVHATEEKITPVVGLPTISSEEATATVVVPTETVPDVATVPSDMSIEATVADADIALEGVPSVAAPPVSEQELATDEWQRWLTGRQRTTAAPVPTNVAGPAIVNEVSERLAHALQRVLGARAGCPCERRPTNLCRSRRLPTLWKSSLPPNPKWWHRRPKSASGRSPSKPRSTMCRPKLHRANRRMIVQRCWLSTTAQRFDG